MFPSLMYDTEQFYAQKRLETAAKHAVLEESYLEHYRQQANMAVEAQMKLTAQTED